MEHFLATWGYLALFVVNFISAMLIPIGSEAAMGYAGALASGELASGSAHLELFPTIVVAILGDVVGSCVGYAIGRFGGRPLVDRAGRFVLLTHRDLDRAEAWFARRGEPFVLFGRLIPLLRSFVSVVAGLGEMAFAKFLAFTVLGCGIWCAGLVSAGYGLGASWNSITKDFSDAGYVVAALVVLGIVAVVLHRLSVLRAERAAHSPAGRQARTRAQRDEA